MELDYFGLFDKEAEFIRSKSEYVLRGIDINTLLKHMAEAFDELYCQSISATEGLLHSFSLLLSEKLKIGNSPLTYEIKDNEIKDMIAIYHCLSNYSNMKACKEYKNETWNIMKDPVCDHKFRLVNKYPEDNKNWNQINEKYFLSINYYNFKNFLHTQIHAFGSDKEIKVIDDTFNSRLGFFMEYFRDLKMEDIYLFYHSQSFKLKHLLSIYAFFASYSFDRYTAYINKNKYLYKGKCTDLQAIYRHAQLQLYTEKDILLEPLMYREIGLLIDIFYNNFKKNWYPEEEISKKQVEAMLSLISWNFEDNSTSLEFVETPFIRYKNNFYFLPNVVGNISLHISLHNLLIRKEIITTKQINKHAKMLEKELSQLLLRCGFNTLNSFTYSFLDRNGEIDVLAYNNNILFVIEVKSTYVRVDYNKIESHILDTLYKGAKQLQGTIDYIKNNLKYFREELGIAEGKDIEIYPLLISTSFEGDNRRFQGIKKISYFEIMGILTNVRRYLHIMQKFAEKSNNQPDQINFLVSEIIPEELKFNRENNFSITGPKLKNIIENGLFWKGFLTEDYIPKISVNELGKYEIRWEL